MPPGCEHDPAEFFLHACPAEPAPPAAAVHALVIGIGGYADPPGRGAERLFAPLDSAAPAATHFARFLRDDFRHPRGIPLHTIRLLLSPTEGQDDYLLADKDQYRPANYVNILQAFDRWATDCDSHRGNVAILYLAGHGLVTSTSARWAFAPEAGSVDSIYTFGIDVTATRQSMEFRRARTQLFIWDLCALLDKAVDNPGGGVPAVALRTRADEDSVEHSGGVEQVTVLPRLGTATWALNSKLGTVLSRALVGNTTDQKSPRLMMTAVEVDDEESFSVTPSGLRRRLPDAVRAFKSGDPGELDTVVDTRAWQVGLNRPDSMPSRTLTLVWNPVEDEDTLSLVITDDTGAEVRTAELQATPGAAADFILPAGSYEVTWEKPSGRSRTFTVKLTQDQAHDALTGRAT